MEKEFAFSETAWDRGKERLVKQVFKLLPMFEKEEDWKKQLEGLTVEFKGYNKIFYNNPDLPVLVAKLLALEEIEKQEVFRRTVFEIISLIKELEYEPRNIV